MREYYYKGRIAFHLGMVRNENQNGWDIITNIPFEILERNNKDVQQLGIIAQAFQMPKDEYIDELAEIIMKDNLSKSFFYPQYLFENSTYLNSEIFDYLSTIIDGFILEPMSFYTQQHEPVKLYVLAQKFYRLKLFYPETFEAITPCSKQEFERNIPDSNAAAEYVDLLTENNQFFYCNDEDIELYFLINKGRLCMILMS